MGPAQKIYFSLALANLLGPCSAALGEDSPASPTLISEAIVPTRTVSQTTVSGRELYLQLCAKCHGTEGSPPAEIKSLLDPPPSDLRAPELRFGNSAEQIAHVIRDAGETNMLHYRNRLTESQIEALSRYVVRMRNAKAD